MTPTLLLNEKSPLLFNIETINFFSSSSSSSISPFLIKLTNFSSYLHSFINFPDHSNKLFNIYNYIYTDNKYPIASFLIASNNFKILYALLSHNPLAAIQGLNNNTYTLLNFAFIQKSNTPIKIIIKLILKTNNFPTNFLLHNNSLLYNFQYLSKSSQLIIIKSLKKIPSHIISSPDSQLFIIQLFKTTQIEKSKSALAHIIISPNHSTLISLINNAICFFYNNTLKILINKIVSPPINIDYFYDSPIINSIQANNIHALFIVANHFSHSYSFQFQNPLMTAIEYNFYNIYFNKDFIPSIIQLFPQDLFFHSTSGYRIYKNLPLLFSPLDSACYYNNTNFILLYLHSLTLEDYSFQLLSTHYPPNFLQNWWASLKFAQNIDSILLCQSKIMNQEQNNEEENALFKDLNKYVLSFQDLIPDIFNFFL